MLCMDLGTIFLILDCFAQPKYSWSYFICHVNLILWEACLSEQKQRRSELRCGSRDEKVENGRRGGEKREK